MTKTSSPTPDMDEPDAMSRSDAKPSTFATPGREQGAPTDRYAALFERVPVGLYCTTLDGHIVEANPTLAAILGFRDAQELIGFDVYSLYTEPGQRDLQMAAIEEARTPQVTEIRLRRSDGALIWARDTFCPVYDAEGRLLHFEGSLEDITQEHQTLDTLRRLNRSLRAVMQCNEAVVHASDEASLLDQVCGILVDVGGYALAWVGRPVHDKGKTVRPVAQRGRAEGYLDKIKVTWGYDRRGRGPMGVALRTIRPCACRDIATDPAFGPWRDLALEAGFRSTIAVPLIVRGRAVAAVGVYAEEPDAFDAEENRLLEAVARNVSLGIVALQMNAERDQLLQALYESESRLSKMLENVPLLAVALDRDGEASFCNEYLLRVIGLSRSQVLGSQWIERFVPEEEHGRMGDLFVRMLDPSSAASQFSGDIITAQGDRRTISWNATTNLDLDARAIGVTLLGQDVTDNLRAAAARDELMTQVIAAHERLQALSRQLVRLQEEERRSLSRELHDEIGQSLTGLKLMLDMALKTPATTDDVLRQAQSLLNELIGKVRDLSLDLRPGMLDDLGLVPALLWLFKRYTAQTNVQIRFNHTGIDGQRFTSEVETAAYRIIQEALTNVARHAGTHTARVQVLVGHHTMHVEIEDHGRGFEPDSLLTSGAAAGLSGLRERAVLLGGRLAIESARGSGTRVVADLPVI